ncbi:helix-turn-helix transcriptional regulator [Kocuria atrinae]|uniref:response regulator transcription factor n=1 Tax=Kocuria atrinae TaxID=592377 RepID=UPI001CB9307E
MARATRRFVAARGRSRGAHHPGATNDEIARTCYLSINSVKSYIRSAYRKMGVERRSQAVLWGVQNGMEPTVARS